ncbi:MAG: class I SAM-dependent methyltransferase [Proteobacteria bacterium]|nr:class I SAM-dependent methyltransferase [Pseudomonadota bacterium]
MTDQRDIFLKSEGDGFFGRNRAQLLPDKERPSTTRLIEFLRETKGPVRHVTEIGCGNGSELLKICTALECEGTGFEPSGEAVADGNRMAAELGQRMTLFRGTAEDLPLPDESSDVLLFGFCLYLVDRRLLLPAMGEAYRVLRPGGFLAIVDFDPAQQHRRAYAHHDGLWSYKQDYSRIPLATGLYSLAAKVPMSHAGDGFEADADERVALNILYKEPAPYPMWQAPGAVR